MTYIKLLPILKERDLDIVGIYNTKYLMKLGKSAMENKNIYKVKFYTYQDIFTYLRDNPDFNSKSF